MEKQEDFCPEECWVNNKAVIYRCRRYQNLPEGSKPPCLTRSSLEQTKGPVVTRDGILDSYDPAPGRNYLRFFS